MAAQLLVTAGHHVILHARSEQRAAEALSAVPGANSAVVGDLSSLKAMHDVARQVNRLGRLDAVIHNAAIGYREGSRGSTVDGLPAVFAINSLAPYVLTALIQRPHRLIYVSSGMHHGADPGLDDLAWTHRRWNGSRAYAESKLHNVILAFAIARKWPDVLSNALEPGWVATKMGGPGAPDDLQEGPKTQVWLATSDEPAATVTGGYFYHLKQRHPNRIATEVAVQERFIAECARISGVSLPDADTPRV
jgi:NAD(P)-dependent dehydrogenase (short-subunit alcohol dehydrogenase family)